MAGARLTDALFSDVKAYLNITWEDDVTNTKTRNIITQGMFFLDDKLGEPGNYANEGYPRMLLFEYVRYARDEALDVFEINYRSMILAMQNKRKVNAYVEKNAISSVE